MNVNKWLKWTTAWRKEKVTPIVKDSDKWHELVGNVGISMFTPLEERQYAFFHEDNKYDYAGNSNTMDYSIVKLLAKFDDNFPNKVVIKSADIMQEKNNRYNRYYGLDFYYYLYNTERTTYNEILNALFLETGSIEDPEKLANLINNIPKLFLNSWYDESNYYENGRDNWSMTKECLSTIGECANTRVLVKALPLVNLNSDSACYETTEDLFLGSLVSYPLRYLAMTKVTPEQQVKADIVTAIFEHDPVKANELITLLSSIDKPEYTDLRGKAQ